MGQLTPSSKDLSREKIRSEVVSQALQRPATVYTAAIAGLGAVWGGLFAFSPVVGAVTLVGLACSLGSAAFEYFGRKDVHANRYIKALKERLHRQREEALTVLKLRLEKSGYADGLRQLALFVRKYDNFVSILDSKLEPGELTYNRYSTIAEQVFLAGLDNLESATLARASVQAIDTQAIQAELNSADSATDARREHLQQRLALYESQQRLAKELLLQNEFALTQLDHVAARIANVNTQQGHAQIDLEDAMAELQHLIERAEDYSRQ